MAIKISGTIAIDDNRKGSFDSTNPGVFTESERDALSPTTGDIIWNSTAGELQVYNGSAWAASGGGGELQTKASGGTISVSNNYTYHVFTSSGTFTAPSGFNETVHWAVIGGGGGGGGAGLVAFGGIGAGASGGGAGNYQTGTLSLSGPISVAVTVGTGGDAGVGSADGVSQSTPGSPGGTSVLNFPTVITADGGAGGINGNGAGLLNGNGSGSGGGYLNQLGGTTTGSSFAGTIESTPSNGWAGSGGASGPNTGNGTGGSGGAGANGVNSGGGNQSVWARDGAAGVQLPAVLRTVAGVGNCGPTVTSVTGADDTGRGWVAGAGGTGYYYVIGMAFGTNSAVAGVGGSGGGGPSGTYAPGTYYPTPGHPGAPNTGSGGGGGSRSDQYGDKGSDGGKGGNGIVIIAYPL